MSWSFHAIGTVEGLLAAIDRESATLSALSKEEFEQAAPHLKGLVAMNTAQYPKIIQVIANGHAVKAAEGVLESSCYAEIKHLSAKLVI